MPTATSTIEVDVPLRTAYNQWTQFESFPRFMDGVEKVEQRDDATTYWVMSVGGVKREFEARITDQEPDRHIAWHSTGELQQGGRVEFRPKGADHTEVTLTLDWEPEGFVENAGAVLQVDDALVATDLKMFKDFIEDRGVEEGGWRGEIDGGRSVDDASDATDRARAGEPLVSDIDDVMIPPFPNRHPGPM